MFYKSLLHVAANNNNIEMMKLLLDKGYLDVNTKSKILIQLFFNII